MAWFNRRVQTVLTSIGALAATSLMSVAIGTDFWLYSRAHICNTTSNSTDETQNLLQKKKTRGDLTHSGLWKICCIEGINNGSCYWINHFSVEDYDTDNSEYILRIMRASSLFPILSTILLVLGGLCVGIGNIYSSRNNITLSAGILFVSADYSFGLLPLLFVPVLTIVCLNNPFMFVNKTSAAVWWTMFPYTARLSNIIGIIVYISSNTGDPGDKKGEDKKNLYSYGWSFYSGVLSFVLAEVIGVMAVNVYIEKNKEVHFKHFEINKTAASPTSTNTSIPSYLYKQQWSQSCSQSKDQFKNTAPITHRVVSSSLPLVDISMYMLGGENPLMADAQTSYNTNLNHPNFRQVHSHIPKDGLNHRITPV